MKLSIEEKPAPPSAMKLTIEEKQKSSLPIPFREWANILRWTFPAATLVALIWVFRLDLNCVPGATLRASHPVRKITTQLTPYGGPAGLETWVLPLHKLRDADTMALYAEYVLSEHKRVTLGTPELSVNARMRYALGPFEPRPPMRLLLGDDPPGERLRSYASWIDALTDINDPSAREHVRGFMRFADRLAQTLKRPDDDHLTTSYLPLFGTSVWREHDDRIALRLGGVAGDDSSGARFVPPAGTLIGPATEGFETRNRMLWFLPAVVLALLYALRREYRRDRTGWKCMLAGMIGAGVWTLAAWEWLISPLDPVTYLLLPIPFYLGIVIARKVRMIGAGPDPENALRKLFKLFSVPTILLLGVLIAGGILLNGLSSRLLLAAGGILFGAIVAHGWCLTEDMLAPRYRAIPRDPKRRYWVLIFVFPVIGWFVEPIWQMTGDSMLQPLLTTPDVDTTLVTEPYWIGPIAGDKAVDFLTDLRKRVPDAEVYHPALRSPKELSDDDREWLQPTHSVPILTGSANYSNEELEVARMDILGGWNSAVDRIDNLVRRNPYDVMMTRSWTNELSMGGVQRVTQELLNPHFDWSPKALSGGILPPKNKDDSRQVWRLLAMDQSERAAFGLRNAAGEMLYRNAKTVGGTWYDAFHIGGGETIAVVYTNDAQAIQSFAQAFPPTMHLAGPAVLRIAERELMKFAALAGLALLFAALIATAQKRWWFLLCSLAGVAAGSGIAVFFGVPMAAVVLGCLVGFAFLQAVQDRRSAILLGVVLLPIPVAGIAVGGVVLFMGGIIRAMGNAD